MCLCDLIVQNQKVVFVIDTVDSEIIGMFNLVYSLLFIKIQLCDWFNSAPKRFASVLEASKHPQSGPALRQVGPGTILSAA